jgi:glycosyltransferase involved in cell wall biosynthesis
VTVAGRPQVVVNATAIGRRPDGIGVYGVHLVRALVQAAEPRPLTVVLNEAAAGHFGGMQVPRHVELRWIRAAVSPDQGGLGHLARWLFAQLLARRHRGALVVGLSQMEAVLGRARQVVTVHDTIPYDFPRDHPRQHRYFRHVLGHALARAAVVVAPSEATRRRLLARYRLPGDRVRVIPHGVPVPLVERRREAAHRGRFVLWLGRLGPMKNLDTLIEAFQRVHAESGHTLVIAGPGPHPAALARGGGATGVRCVGPIGEPQKLWLLDHAALLVCPSLDEGFGLPPLEALARGCPVVVSRRGSLPEVCGDAAVYIEPHDTAALGEALVAVLADRELRDRLANHGLARARHYSWELSARAHLAALAHALGGQPGPCEAPGRALGADRTGPPVGVPAVDASRPTARPAWN